MRGFLPFLSASLLTVTLLHFSPSAPDGAALAVEATLEARKQESGDLRLLSETIRRATAVGRLYRQLYQPGWEGANGAIGDAHLFAVTGDSSLYFLYRTQFDLRQMYNGTWVDDRAWICLAEMYWWDFTGRKNRAWVDDARKRYLDAREEGRLSSHEGFWSWYNWPPTWKMGDQIFTNSNMNQMVLAACWLYEATKEKRFYVDALLVWNGDSKKPGIEKTYYRGDGRWEGREGPAAFGKQLPWEGLTYCSVGAGMYRMTGDPKYKKIVVETAKRVLDPATNWVDPEHFYQLRMDGNGAFVHFILDAYLIAPDELSDIPHRVERMLNHVWSNNEGRASVILHRLSDDAIRNGWNPHGGEDGYFVNQLGGLHAQSQAVRAFGVFSYALREKIKNRW